MNPLTRFTPRNAVRRLVTFAILAVAALGVCGVATGCSDAQRAAVEKGEAVVNQDAKSPAGQQLLADITKAGLNVGLDIATGNEPGAVIAGIQGAASAIRDYEGLPVAPSSATIANVAAAGSGVARVAITLNSSLGSIIDQAKAAAAQQKVNLSTDDIIEALARGFDSVAPAKGV